MPEWMTTKQVAQHLQVSESTVYRWVSEGKLRAYHIGRTRRFRKEDVDALAVPIQLEAEEDVADEA